MPSTPVWNTENSLSAPSEAFGIVRSRAEKGRLAITPQIAHCAIPIVQRRRHATGMPIRDQEFEASLMAFCQNTVRDLVDRLLINS